MRRTYRVAAVLAALVLGGTLASPARADVPPQPGNFRGKGFDQCNAPSQAAMDRWLTHSPYQAVGIYISGRQRACREQANLTPTWVKAQVGNGWRLLPITLDHQPYCISRFPRYGEADISTDPANGYYKARVQGVNVAQAAIDAAKRLGLPAGTTLWLDIEGFDYTNTVCRTSTMAFQHGWNGRLRGLGYVPGLYSSASSGIKMLDAERQNPSSYRWSLPARIWIARWDGNANTSTTYIPDVGWLPGGRMKQYLGGHDETWGGVTINIDTNWLALGSAWRVQPEAAPCGGININFPSYATFVEGQANSIAQVKALQCLLKSKGIYTGTINGKYDAPTIAAAVKFQQLAGRPASRRWRPHDWTALHAHGPVETVKVHSTAPVVRRLQRALNAALGAGLEITGHFDGATVRAVKTYQAHRSIAQTGNVVAGVWWNMKRGGI